jgi:hypothetical protein
VVTLFGDDRRWLKLGLVLAAVGAMGGYYAWIAMHVVGYRECVAAGAAREGQRLVFPTWDVTGIDAPGRFRISKVIQDVPIRGDTSGMRLGDTISIAGTYDAASREVVETDRERHPLRRWKERLGVAGFLVAVLAAPLAFRIRGRRVEER